MLVISFMLLLILEEMMFMIWIGTSDEELTFWANRLKAYPQDCTTYAYFNNDPEAYAVKNALRLCELVGTAAVMQG